MFEIAYNLSIGCVGHHTKGRAIYISYIYTVIFIVFSCQYLSARIQSDIWSGFTLKVVLRVSSCFLLFCEYFSIGFSVVQYFQLAMVAAYIMAVSQRFLLFKIWITQLLKKKPEITVILSSAVFVSCNFFLFADELMLEYYAIFGQYI